MNWGGQEFRTILECLWLNEHGHQVWLMCHPSSEMYKRAPQYGVKNLIAMDLTKTWRLDRALRIWLFCLRNNIDLINSHGSRDSVLCIPSRILGLPVFRSRQITNPIKKIFSYKYCCTHIVAAASAIKNTLIKQGVNADKITVIGEGVDLQEYSPRPRPQSLLEEFSLTDGNQVVINIGMLRPDKGQEYFLEAAKTIIAKNKNVHFFVIGDATRKKKTKEKLLALVAKYQLEDNFRMLGYRNDVADFINLADLVVVASTGTEAQSRIVPQSFASAKTVVSANTGGLGELVKDRHNGLIVEAANGPAMAAAIEELLNDSPLREKLSAAGYQFAQEKLSINYMMQLTVDTYQRVTNSK